MATVYPRQYKIDESNDHWWKYAAYRRCSTFGFEWWRSFRRSDNIEDLRAAIITDMKLPIFINEPDAQR